MGSDLVYYSHSAYVSACRDVKFTESLDYSSAIALLGYSLILAIIRTGNLRVEAARVMVSAPIIAFISTHILYLNLYTFDYGKHLHTGDISFFSLPSSYQTWSS